MKRLLVVICICILIVSYYQPVYAEEKAYISGGTTGFYRDDTEETTDKTPQMEGKIPNVNKGKDGSFAQKSSTLPQTGQTGNVSYTLAGTMIIILLIIYMNKKLNFKR